MKGINQRSEAAKSFREAEDYNKQASFIRANSATINYNASQQFGEWLAGQPADNTTGHLGTRGAAHIMAHNPKLAMAYAGQYMAERGLNPGGVSTPSSAQVRNQYDAERGPQAYAVTKDSLQQVRNQAGDITSNSGISTRQHAEEKITQGRTVIVEGANEARGQGSTLKQELNIRNGLTLNIELGFSMSTLVQVIKTFYIFSNGVILFFSEGNFLSIIDFIYKLK